VEDAALVGRVRDGSRLGRRVVAGGDLVEVPDLGGALPAGVVELAVHRNRPGGRMHGNRDRTGLAAESGREGCHEGDDGRDLHPLSETNGAAETAPAPNATPTPRPQVDLFLDGAPKGTLGDRESTVVLEQVAPGPTRCSSRPAIRAAPSWSARRSISRCCRRIGNEEAHSQ